MTFLTPYFLKICEITKNLFFGAVECAGRLNKQEIQEAAKARELTFVEILPIDSRETICVDIFINGFYKCFFIDISNAKKSSIQALTWGAALSTPALSLRLLTLKFPIELQTQIIIQALINQRRIASGAIAIGTLHYIWLCLSEKYPDLVNQGTNYHGETKNDEVQAIKKACAESDESQDNETQQTSDENPERDLIDFCDENGNYLPEKRELAVEKLIEELSGPKSAFTPDQLIFLKKMKFKGNPIISDEQEKNIVLRQTGLLDDVSNNEPSDTLFSEFKFAVRQAELAEPGTPQHDEIVERVNSFIPQIYRERSQEMKDFDLQLIAPGLNEINSLQEKANAYFDDPPSPSGQAVASWGGLQTIMDDLESARIELGNKVLAMTRSNAANSVSEPSSNWLQNLLEYLNDSFANFSTLGAICFF